MKKLFFSLVLCLPALANASELAEKIFETYAPNIVHIRTTTAVGTGFLIANNFIVTNRHVALGTNTNGSIDRPVTMTFKDGYKVESFENLVCSKRVDMCIIQIKPLDRFSKFPYSDRNLKPGEDIFIVGHPKGVLTPLISSGIVSSDLNTMPWQNAEGKLTYFKGFTTTAAISKGSSGSPVISKEGELIGLAVGIFPEAQNLNIVISSKEVTEFAKKNTQKDFGDTIVLTMADYEAADTVKKVMIAKMTESLEQKNKNILVLHESQIRYCLSDKDQKSLENQKLKLTYKDGKVSGVDFVGIESDGTKKCLKSLMSVIPFEQASDSTEQEVTIPFATVIR